MKCSLLAGLGAAAFGAVLALPAAPASASPKAAVSPDAIAASAPVAYARSRSYRGKYGSRHRAYRYVYRRHRGDAVASAALGIIGGIATTAAISSHPYPYTYGGGYGFYPAYSYAYPHYYHHHPYPYWSGGYHRVWYPGTYGYGGGYYGVRWRAGAWR